MSLDVMLNGAVGDELYSANITTTSRVWPMLRGIYMHLWRPQVA